MYKFNKFAPAQKAAEKLLGKENVLTDEVSLSLHSYDCSLGRTRPDAVLKITSTAQLAPLIKILNKHDVPFTARAAATNHVGGCVTLHGGAVLNLSALNKILKIDTARQYAEVECCVIGADLQAALAPLGFFYAPDPASEKICTIGGNVALNAGGARGLKYGATAEHVLKLEFISPAGETYILEDNLKGLIIGAEGTLGLVSKIWLKITPIKENINTILTSYHTVQDAMQAVSQIIAEGIIPRAIEAMDRLTINMVQAHTDYGYPNDCEALLLIESENAKEMKRIEEICEANKSFKTVLAKNEAEKQNLWRGRRAGYAAMAVKSSNVFVEDGTVPRKELPKALKEAREICDKHGLTMGLFFHAGDGNLHPNIVFDARKTLETKEVLLAGKEMLKSAVSLGGTISGEHGVGIEKRAAMGLMFSQSEIDFFKKIKNAFDPKNLCNPGKVIPVSSKLKETQEIKIPADFDVDADNGVVSVNAEMQVNALAEKLEKQNLFLRMPSYNGTIGELFEKGLSEEFTHSITQITAEAKDGQTLHYGGKFVKNSAGYNLIRFFAGANAQYGKTKILILKLYREKQHVPLCEEKPFQNNALKDALKNL